MNKKSVSVIVPSYNYGKFLSEAIESVLAQSRIPDELIIVNDGSTDSTLEIAKKYEESYSFISVINNEKNLGIIPTFNNAVAHSNGDFVCLLGADNRMSAKYVESCANVLDNDENVAIAYTDYILFGELSEEVYKRHFPDWQAGLIEMNGINGYLINFPEWNDELSRGILQKRNFIHGSSMFRKDAFEKVGGYRSRNNSEPEDYGLFVRIVNDGWKAAKAQKEAFLEYRQHSHEQANIKAQERAIIQQFDDVVQHWQRDVLELREAIRLRDEMIANLEDKINSFRLRDLIKRRMKKIRR